MLRGLCLLNLPNQVNIEDDILGDVFLLKTCQRTLILGLGAAPHLFINRQEVSHKPLIFNGKEAYSYLLEIICGMQSRVKGETEISHQFKEAYSQYLKKAHSNSMICHIIEKLMSDSKKIRTEHLKQVSTVSYAAICRKILIDQSSHKNVLVLGTGSLANDLINLLWKKYDLYVSGRDINKVGGLAHEKGVRPVDWTRHDIHMNFKTIINTIGVEDFTLYDEEFFNEWSSFQATRLFLDLGSPSSIQTERKKEDGIYHFSEILKKGEELSQKTHASIEKARLSIDKISQKREETLSIQFTSGWEDLQFN